MIKSLVNLKYFRGGVYTKANRIDGKIVLITGANTGIGKETAVDLAKRGGKVYMACRDLVRSEDALKEVKARSNNDNAFLMQLDLASLDSVRNFSKEFHEREQKLHILVNNAGIMACPRMLTADGFEMQIGVNHLGHFLLTNLLLDLLKAAASSRIVVVSSSGHKLGEINREDFNSEKSYHKIKAYSQSKLANVLFSRELARKLEGSGVTVNSCHPGLVQTELGRHMNPTVRKLLRKFMSPFQKTALEGAQTQIRLAVDPELDEVSGKYFVDCEEADTSEAAKNDDTAQWLWQKSAELTNLREIK